MKCDWMCNCDGSCLEPEKLVFVDVRTDIYGTNYEENFHELTARKLEEMQVAAENYRAMVYDKWFAHLMSCASLDLLHRQCNT